MSISIKKNNTKVKDTMAEHQWDSAQLTAVRALAGRLTRSELILFWLSEMAQVSEERFNEWLSDISKFSKQELIDIIHELGPEAGERFIQKFSGEKKGVR
ncbi:MAG TPA: hypothetical protein VG866_00405 [Candidatus Paceibacterota bacterium]|nr:hypothetical protein [Candidatus Paceibacterota bacterium]